MANKIITAKILEVTRDAKTAIITVELDDGKGKWIKIYKQSQEIIKADQFKKMVAADIRKDLKKDDQLSEINPLVGTKFNIDL